MQTEFGPFLPLLPGVMQHPAATMEEAIPTQTVVFSFPHLPPDCPLTRIFSTALFLLAICFRGTATVHALHVACHFAAFCWAVRARTHMRAVCATTCAHARTHARCRALDLYRAPRRICLPCGIAAIDVAVRVRFAARAARAFCVRAGNAQKRLAWYVTLRGVPARVTLARKLL